MWSKFSLKISEYCLRGSYSTFLLWYQMVSRWMVDVGRSQISTPNRWFKGAFVDIEYLLKLSIDRASNCKITRILEYTGNLKTQSKRRSLEFSSLMPDHSYKILTVLSMHLRYPCKGSSVNCHGDQIGSVFLRCARQCVQARPNHTQSATRIFVHMTSQKFLIQTRA